MNRKSPATEKAAFTLVELIVVITILAILGTIGFFSLQGYSSSARDSQRSSDLASISKALDAMLARGSAIPQPEGNSLALSASGTVIGYQGYAGETVFGIIGFGGKWTDPLDGQYPTYATNSAGTKYQLLNFSEASKVALSPIPEAYATDYSSRYISTRGSRLGILLGSTWSDLNRPIQEYYDAATFTWVDVVNYTGATGSNASFGSLSAVVSGIETLMGTWSQLVGLEMNYRWVIETITNGCPNSSMLSSKPIKIGAGISFSFSGSTSTTPAVVCSLPSNMTIPAGHDFIMSSCPDGWGISTDVAKIGGGFPFTIGGANVAVCVSPSNAMIPSGTKIIMSACPSGWTVSTDAIKIGAGFAFLIGGVPPSVCIAP